MQILLQWVRTSWTKKSRSGAAAAARNTAPIAFELPVIGRAIIHEVTLNECDAFRPISTLRDLPASRPEMMIESVSLAEKQGKLRILPTIPALWQIPPRRRRPPAVHVEPGQWIRWQLNYRFSSATGDGDWSYHLHTLNVAYGPTQPDTFFGTPTRYVDERGSLR
ncbi:hypothetical protein IU427_32685 [Nocardia beijingensis]|uniref:hypothetical protein n=1 Tax=Nocardia beijingensis TaxID=95162 RepID=UPI001896276C|nr:hypothetical protein [Nocardia beijingensis]MBF6469883.1 hypothetical protein [Nocardia beijingensis]